MRFDTPHALLPLAPRRPLRLKHAHGAHLRSESGTLWITVDNDTRDWVLEPGQSLVLDTAQAVLVTALRGEATVALCDAGPATAVN